MTSICLYFQVHQPFRIKPISFFDIGQVESYDDDHQNLRILNEIADRCYLPANELLQSLIEESGEQIKLNFSISGTAIEQFELYRPDVLSSFQRLAKTGQVEFLAETYYHSLASVYSPREFTDQVHKHRAKIKSVFGQTPQVFRNTELIYHNTIAKAAEDLGFKAILCEGVDHFLGGKSPNHMYKPTVDSNINCFLRNYSLSDDIAFRFSDDTWSEYPLTVPKFTRWLENPTNRGEVINLYMDYETFGEHQAKTTGIFEFLRDVLWSIVRSKNVTLATFSEVIREQNATDIYDVPTPSSWADTERDVSAWCGNEMQRDALKRLYDLEQKIRLLGNEELNHSWSKLQTSDHFYYMSTKNWPDNEIHQYFSPFESPYEAYIYFTNVLKDLELYLDYHLEVKQMTSAGENSKILALKN
ncbi:glycoside hydrolase family 57 protein [Fulvivirgaceae bacterium BMA12]|uniref:Glycoside hydrolase family 57 protein n=1 Tax=Agaribacillus aureus TaxID=3051825 RepID=A0ABT8LG79_9BACT|nr:glycoside hydrolase family 57 protein [Fulvivirgaceae bacterium BMA12]